MCDSCHRWSLVPVEDRHGALVELERLARDRGRSRPRSHPSEDRVAAHSQRAQPGCPYWLDSMSWMRSTYSASGMAFSQTPAARAPTYAARNSPTTPAA